MRFSGCMSTPPLSPAGVIYLVDLVDPASVLCLGLVRSTRTRQNHILHTAKPLERINATLLIGQRS